jgi:hypothetical protein
MSTSRFPSQVRCTPLGPITTLVRNECQPIFVCVHLINIKGDSYRLREKKKAGLLGRKPKPVDAEDAAAPA